MTVPATGSRFFSAGNGVTVAFDFPRLYLAKSDVKVYLVDSGGVATAQTLNTDYSLSPAGDTAGGTITFVTAPAAGYTVFRTRDTDRTQNIDLDNVVKFPRALIEEGFDRAMASADEVKQDIDRTIRIANMETSSLVTLPGITSRANKILGFDATGQVQLYTAGVDPYISQYAEFLANLEWVNPCEDRFGAIGNDAANDTAAVQAAADYIGSLGRGVLYINHGHLITSSITCSTGFILVYSPNPYIGYLRCVGAFTGLNITYTAHATNGAPVVDGLGIKKSGTDTTSTGLKIRSTTLINSETGDASGANKGPTVRNCRIFRDKNTSGYWSVGIDTYQTPHARIENNWIDGRGALTATKPGAGILIGHYCNGTMYSHNTIRGFAGGIKFSDAEFIANGGTAQTFQSEGQHIDNNKITNCDNGVWCNIGDVEVSLRITNNSLDNGSTNVLIANMRRVTISGNTMGQNNRRVSHRDILLKTDDGAGTLTNASLATNIFGNQCFRTDSLDVRITAIARGATTVISYELQTSVDEDGNTTVSPAPVTAVEYFLSSVEGTTELNNKPYYAGTVTVLTSTTGTIELRDYYTHAAINSTAYGVFTNNAQLEPYAPFVEVQSGKNVLIYGNQLGARHAGVHAWSLTDSISYFENQIVSTVDVDIINDSANKSTGRVYVTPEDGSNEATIPLEKCGVVAGKFDIITAAANRVAIMAALALGLTFSGAGKTYAVSGEVVLPTGARLWDATFQQMAPGASRTVITLSATSVNNIVLRRVKVNRNGDGTNNGANAANLPNVSLGLAFGIKISGGTGHHLEDLEVYGNDSGTLIGIFNLDYTSKVIRPYAHDCLTVVAGPTDDMACGITFQGNDRLVVDSPRAARIGWKALIGDANPVARSEGAWLYSRGISTTGNTGLVLMMPRVEDAWQGIDNSGDVNDGNVYCQIVHGHVYNATTWGYKWANLQRGNLISQSTAELCGYAGFVCSADYQIVDFDTQTVNFIVGNVITGATSGASGTVSRVYDTGAAGWVSLTSWNQIAFTDNENLQVSGVTRALANIPASLVSLAITNDDANIVEDCVALDCGTAGGTRGGFLKLDGIRNYSVPIKFIRCKAIDRRAIPVMPNGFFAEIDQTSAAWNEAIDCTVTGATTNAFRGLAVQNTFEHRSRLSAGRTLTNTAAVQAIFSSTKDELTLESASIYEFECEVYLSTLAASNSFAFSLPGTAVFTGNYSCDAAKIAAVAPSTFHTTEKTISNSFAARTLTTANANTQGYFLIKGTITTGATGGGTIIPSISLGTAAAADVLAHSFFSARKIAASTGNKNDNTLAGAWS